MDFQCTLCFSSLILTNPCDVPCPSSHQTKAPFSLHQTFPWVTTPSNLSSERHRAQWLCGHVSLSNFHCSLTTRGSVRGLGMYGKVSRRKVVISRRSWQAAIFSAKGQQHLVGFTVPRKKKYFYGEQEDYAKSWTKRWRTFSCMVHNTSCTKKRGKSRLLSMLLFLHEKARSHTNIGPCIYQHMLQYQHAIVFYHIYYSK